MLNLGDIVKFNNANSYSVGEVVAIYKLKESNVKIEEDEEYKYDVETFDTIETFTISEKEVEKRYVEYDNSCADFFFEGASKVKEVMVDDTIEEPSVIRLMDIYKAFENGDTIVINYSEYINNCNVNGTITNIDKSDFQQPFEIDDDFYIEFDYINYVKINGKTYDDITLDLYVDEIIEYSKLGYIDILKEGEIYEEFVIKDIKDGLINIIGVGIYDLDDVELRICCSNYISSKKINILYN